jgi:ribosomal protein L30/L7E
MCTAIERNREYLTSKTNAYGPDILTGVKLLRLRIIHCAGIASDTAHYRRNISKVSRNQSKPYASLQVTATNYTDSFVLNVVSGQ